MIAHRLSTIQDVDLVFVVDNGRITETGTYDELLTRGGAFTALVLAQSASATVLELPSFSLGITSFFGSGMVFILKIF